MLAEQKENGAPRKLVGIEMIDRGIPRHGYKVYSGDEVIGEVTTGTQSPTLKKNIGLALIDKEYYRAGYGSRSGDSFKTIKSRYNTNTIL